MISKSLGTTVSGKTARASRAAVRAEVAGREMREREQLDAGVARELGRVDRGRVRGLERALPLVLEEGRLVDEQVRVRAPPRAPIVCGAVSPAITTVRPGRDSPEHLVGRDGRAVGERDRLAALERAALGPEWNAERVGGLDVELPRAVVLDERVADRRARRARPGT